jgi:hypothetical protein
MNWTVVYRPSANDELANIWMDALDRQAVSQAANSIEKQLGSDPLLAGESREENMRVIIEPPLAIHYDVVPDDKLVTVWYVREWR